MTNRVNPPVSSELPSRSSVSTQIELSATSTQGQNEYLESQNSLLRLLRNFRGQPPWLDNFSGDESSAWYFRHLARKWCALPVKLRSCLEAPGSGQRHGSDAKLFKVIETVASMLSDVEIPSLEYISARLIEGNLFLDNNQTADQHSLVFTIIGWLTMFYMPCSSHQDDGYVAMSLARDASGQAMRTDIFNVYSQPLKHVESEPIHLMLRMFGNLIPGSFKPPPKSVAVDLFSEQLVVSCLNYSTLSRIANITVVNTQCLSLHLDLDEQTQTLKIFQFPSYCMALYSASQPNSDSEGPRQFLSQLLQDYFAGQSSGNRSNLEGAYAYHFNDLLREVILSYRLIFGQHRKSQAEFRKQNVADDVDDLLLPRLCGQSWEKEPVYRLIGALPAKDQYSAREDFPILSARLLRLQKYTMEQNPSDLWSLWYDRRDICKQLRIGYRYTVEYFLTTPSTLLHILGGLNGGRHIDCTQHRSVDRWNIAALPWMIIEAVLIRRSDVARNSYHGAIQVEEACERLCSM